MRNIIGRLGEEELKRARRVQARSLLAQSGRQDIPIGEAMNAIEEDWEFIAKVRRQHEIPDDETFDLNLADGVISEGEEA